MPPDLSRARNFRLSGPQRESEGVNIRDTRTRLVNWSTQTRVSTFCLIIDRTPVITPIHKFHGPCTIREFFYHWQWLPPIVRWSSFDRLRNLSECLFFYIGGAYMKVGPRSGDPTFDLLMSLFQGTISSSQWSNN